MSLIFWINHAAWLFLIVFVGFLAGWLALFKGVKINYTRKINHFSYYLSLLLVDFLFPLKLSPLEGIFRILICFGSFLVLTEPVRRRFRFAEIMFIGYDRPEDRPHTLRWILTQMLAGFVVLIPLQVYFQRKGLEILVLLPTVVNVLGDGLAEPVGVRWGKHTYQTRALGSDKLYTRSFEGSSMVFLSALLAVFLVSSVFTPLQFAVALVLIPILATLTEAFSPHTWDTPFIFLVCGLTPLAIRAWV